ncbi:MAG: hypothetical protein GXN91_05600 [Epsilonproteobacteria bacterium]|nr:hypothetical protein [Campylobacterota bacterium]
MNKNYSLKQLERYRRQKYISALNKCTKNLYKIFKNPTSSYESYRDKFIELKEEIDRYSDVYIQADHIKKIKEYIESLYKKTILSPLSPQEFKEIKSQEATNLNRLQKIRNQLKYNKHRYRDKEY